MEEDLDHREAIFRQVPFPVAYLAVARFPDILAYQFFRHTVAFDEVVDAGGSGHGALAGFLSALKVDALICGGIGGGAQMALSDVGIRLYGGVSGNADAAAEALVAGKLDFNPNVRCDHHDHHGEGHSCGSHGCGHHSCD
ncbi:NifB/NifX family molybdenum-iron cluster-binding protein [Megasphaera sp.]|uniref:NifB/NifX family molybdenum-iron cluster-binding protein n=1 Tax=Megasphaera sp. TaxID=2023260 RepID=UPI0025C2ADFC|nr:NifB/NifX family molybdenum-iron cluster-binding protein [Megasphaera sp.]